jgi:hypothetical protein
MPREKWAGIWGTNEPLWVVFRETHDGEMLLRILQSSGGDSSEGCEWTVDSVARLFSAIDRDDDKVGSKPTMSSVASSLIVVVVVRVSNGTSMSTFFEPSCSHWRLFQRPSHVPPTAKVKST